MKREHKTEDIPFIENLVFYAPLDSEGDLKDYISGDSFYHTGQGSYSFDSTENAYSITSPSSSAKATLVIDTDLDIMLSNQSEYTVFAKILLKTSSSNDTLLGLGNWNESTSFKPHINTSNNFISATNVWLKCAYLGLDNNGSGRICRYYVSGNNEYESYSHASNPANWDSSNKCAKRVCVGVNRLGNIKNFLIKDLMIFNRKLSQEEINSL